MPESSLEILGLIGVATAFALALRGLSNRLRRGQEVPEAAVAGEPAPLRDPSGKYFVVAVVGFALHAGSFYFYLWGAAAGIPKILKVFSTPLRCAASAMKSR